MSNYIVQIALVAFIIGVAFYVFIRSPREQRVKNIKEWLKYAVVEAEKALGSGTGQLKLRMVYDMAVKQFPWVMTLVTFETFSDWVDEALEWMNKQLEQNKATQEYVENK